ncbi:MAG: HlyD family efflux transporter periplasmic adaptor subunit [Sediminicola sp.]|tara:strand:+ start:58008 stop:59135 length:1128 start_codon:yes stop_codon:yes gene_type:complete
MQAYYPDNKSKLYNVTKGLLLFLLIATAITGCNNSNYVIPQRKDIVDVVFASGYIAKSTEYNITSNVDGFLRQSFLSEGDSISIGTALFTISNEVQHAELDNALIHYNDAKLKASSNSPQIAQTKVQIEQAKTQLDLDRKNFERYAKLIKSSAVSEVDFEKSRLQLQTSENNLKILEATLMDLQQALNVSLHSAKNALTIQQENNADYLITAMLNGSILNIYKKLGELVKRGEVLAKVGGGKDIIKLYVAEDDINRIALGQGLKVALNTKKNRLFSAEISRIYPAFDRVEQSFIVEAIFTEPMEELFSGTQLQANIIIAHKENALLLPIACIAEGDSVQTKDKKVYVTVGIRNNDWAEIIEGLDEDSEVQVPKVK